MDKTLVYVCQTENGLVLEKDVVDKARKTRTIYRAPLTEMTRTMPDYIFPRAGQGLMVQDDGTLLSKALDGYYRLKPVPQWTRHEVREWKPGRQYR